MKLPPRAFVTRGLIPLAFAPLHAALVAAPSGGVVLARGAPDGIVSGSSPGLALVNAGVDFVERKNYLL